MAQIVKTAILGINRDTASLGLGLKAYAKNPKSKLTFTITGCDRDSAISKAAAKIGALDETQNKLHKAVQGADIVIVALPPGDLERAFEDFGSELKPGAVVLAMSLSQRQILELARQHFPHSDDGSPQAFVVGIHPLVHGSYLGDPSDQIEDADEKRYAHSEMIIAPEAKCPSEAIKLAGDLAEILDMQPRFLSPDEFDGYIDFTEKLPLLISAGIFAAMQSSGGRHELERAINPTLAQVLTPLRGLTGPDLAAVWAENPEIAVQHLDQVILTFTRIRELVARQDHETIQELAGELAAAYAIWAENRRAGQWRDATTPAIPGKFNFFSNLLGLGAFERAVGKSERPSESRER